MHIGFSVNERILIGSILPNHGSYLDLKIIRQLKEDLSFSEEEHAALGIHEVVVPGGKVMKWNADAVPTKSIELGSRALEVIRSSLKSLDDNGLLEMEYIPTYERFVINGPYCHGTDFCSEKES